MQFEQTKTYKNLARSFAGESQAGMRYQLIARMATEQGYEQLANAIKVIAKNETHHARRFFEMMQQYAKSPLNTVEWDAGYPFHGGTIEQCLQLATNDERVEHHDLYPLFANDAKEEGFDDIAELFTMVAQVEKHHEAVFNYLYEAFKSGTLYTNPTPILYICSECGHMYTGTQAWDICPLCQSSQGYVELHLPYDKEHL